MQIDRAAVERLEKRIESTKIFLVEDCDLVPALCRSWLEQDERNRRTEEANIVLRGEVVTLRNLMSDALKTHTVQQGNLVKQEQAIIEQQRTIAELREALMDVIVHLPMKDCSVYCCCAKCCAKAVYERTGK